MRTTVPMVRSLVLICTFLSLSFSSFSQSIMSGNGKYEIGIGVGPMYFLGDLGGHNGEGTTFLKDLNMPMMKLSKGAYVNLFPAEWIGFRLAINHGVVEGDDAVIKDKGGDERFRKDRNLSFRSSVLEAYAATEIYPTVFIEQYDELAGKLRPYGVVGVGAFKFNPKTKYGNKMVPVKELRLEGQGMSEYPDRKEYSLISYEIPMGFGAKYYIKENMYVGMEVLHRKTFTDYMDDVSTTYINPDLFDKYLTPQKAALAKQLHYKELSAQTRANTGIDGEQRGDPSQKDSFFSTIIKFGWRLNDWNSPNGRASRQLRCPSFY
ncbi:MAG: DUF6089 family protein [Chitinophagaceae bacterium]